MSQNMNDSTKANHKTTTKLVLLNARGLKMPEKRTQVLLSMRKLKADIVCIQKTHFKTDNVLKFLNLHYPTASHATNKESKVKGVSILISKNYPIQIADTLIDEE